MKNYPYLLLLIVLVSFLLSNVTQAYTITRQKLLIYGFTNVIQDSDNNELNVKLSIFLYDHILNAKRKYKVYIIGNSIDNPEEKKYELNFNEEYLYKLAEEKGFDLVLYGFYDIKQKRLKIYPRLLIADREIIVDPNKNLYPSIYSAIKKAKKLSLNDLIAYQSKNKLRKVQIDYQNVIYPAITLEQKEEIVNKKKNKSIFSLPIRFEISNHLGVIFPANIWDMLYSAGFFNDIDLSVLSIRKTFPISLTFQTRYSLFNMSDSSEYIDSSLNMFYLGLGLNYNIHIKKFIDRVRFSISGGFTNTILKINNKNFESFDPTGNLELSAIFRINRTLKFRLGVGGIFISYISYPFSGFYTSAGIIFGK